MCCVPAEGVPVTTTVTGCQEQLGGTVVASTFCEEAPVSICCDYPMGFFAYATNYECAVDGGSQAPISACQEPQEICCLNYGQTFISNPADCLAKEGTIILMQYCEEPPVEVCCQVDGTGLMTTADDCTSLGGAVVSDALCEEACCEIDGVPVDVTMIECEILGGSFLPPEDCDVEMVCCELPTGPDVLSAVDCANQGGSVTSMDACDLCDVDVSAEVVLMITEPSILAAFPMEEVMDQLALLGPGGGAGQTGTEVFQQWWSSQRERQMGDPANHPFCDDNGSTINGFPIQCPRNESQLEAFDATSHHPTAIVNRFDLAPTNGAHCGEYRLVYAKNSGVGGGSNFIIFEGVLPNPDPACGLVGCRPVAEFWASLELVNDPAIRASLLHDFYYQGLPGFEPIVRPESYGFVPAGTPSGQIRTNQFMSFDWNLREFILTESCTGGTCEMLVQQTTVKGNPSPELWDGSHPLSASYESDFVAQMALQQPAVEDVNNLGMETLEIYNTGESDSQGNSGPTAAVYNPTGSMATAIGNAIPGASFLTVADVAERAQTMTCGGCHQTSSAANLGTQFSAGIDLLWPPQIPAFVHIDANSLLSTALTEPGGFLDRRKQVLEDFLLTTCDEDCLTDPIVVLNDGSLFTQKEVDAAFAAEEATLIAEIAEKCAPQDPAESETEADGGASSGAEEAPEDKDKAEGGGTSGDGAEEAPEDKDKGEGGDSGGDGDGTDSDNGDNSNFSQEQCAADLEKGFVSEMEASIKPTPSDPLKTTLSGATTH